MGDHLPQAVQELVACDRAGLGNRRLVGGHGQIPGYCLEMICADFLAGANLETGNLDALLISMGRLFEFLPRAQKQQFLEQIRKAS